MQIIFLKFISKQLIFYYILGQEHKCTKELEGSCHPKDKLLKISENLSIVEIQCSMVDSRVCKVLMFLSTFVTQVNIIKDERYSTCK